MKVESWAKVRMIPRTAFYKMPVAKVDRSIVIPGSAERLEDPEDFFNNLKQSLGYVDTYRENHGEFSDDEVVGLLDTTRSLVELFAYFQLFGSVTGMEMHAAQLLEYSYDRTTPYTSRSFAGGRTHI